MEVKQEVRVAVGLHIPFDRPLAGLVADRLTARPPAWRPLPLAPYAPPRHREVRSSIEQLVDNARIIEVVTVIARAILWDSVTSATLVADLEAVVSPDVLAWSPTIYATSRSELIEALLRDDDSLTDICVTIGAVDVVMPAAYVEWRLEGRFTNPLLVDDDLLVEPTGAVVQSAGILVVRFQEDWVAELCCYYDDLALLEQVVTGR